MLSFSWCLMWLTTGYDRLWQHTCIASLDMSAALRQFSLCSVLPLHSSAVTHQATAKISQVKSFDPRSQMEGIRQVRTKDFNHWRSSLSTITVTSRSAARLLGLQLIGHHRVSQPKKKNHTNPHKDWRTNHNYFTSNLPGGSDQLSPS